MGNYLIPTESTFEIVKGVGSALTSFLSTYQRNHIIIKAQKEILIDRIKAYQAIQHSNNASQIVSNNISQVGKIVNQISELHLSGTSLDIVMKQLEILGTYLEEVVEDYKRGL